MAELMSKEDFLDLFYVMAMGQDKRFIEAVEQVVNDTPTINEHGHWILEKGGQYAQASCSNCGTRIKSTCGLHGIFTENRFCKICGAKMDGSE